MLTRTDSIICETWHRKADNYLSIPYCLPEEYKVGIENEISWTSVQTAALDSVPDQPCQLYVTNTLYSIFTSVLFN